ncbi:MAG: cupin domain-containing protein [Bacteroidales bacterium]|jgi:quercetin dioxygenase-like cupin family protein
MVGITSKNGYTEILNGIKIKTLCYGENMCMVEFILDKGSMLPEHSHQNEQTGYLVKGKIRLFINGNSKEFVPGDSWNIKMNAKHKAEIIEESIAIEVFYPVREDYLKYIYKKDIIL